MKARHFTAQRLEAAAFWHDLLQAAPDPQAVIDGLLDAQRRQRLSDKGKPLCTVARPRFVAAAEMVVEEHAVTYLSSAILKVRDRVLADAGLRAAYLGGFDDWAAPFLALEPRRHETRSILRFDSLLSPSGLKFVEVNGDIPGGAVCNDALLRLWQALDLFPLFRQRYEVRPALADLGLLQALMTVWRSWGGCGTPRVCVLSLPGGIEDILAVLTVEMLQGLGFDVTHAYAEHLDFAAGRLSAKGRVVDVLYRVQRIGDCLRDAEALRALFEAVAAEAVCLINPFHSALLSNKALFSLLTDTTVDFGFSDAEEAAVRAHVPWARTLRDARSTDARGEPVDLLAHVLAHRDELVVKPAHEAGGAGVRLGWECTAAEWEEAVAAALTVDSVVQQRVDEAVTEYPLLEPGFPVATFYEDTDPFVFPGGYVAVLDRISAAAITNVSQGGSIVPTFVIEPRRGAGSRPDAGRARGVPRRRRHGPRPAPRETSTGRLPGETIERARQARPPVAPRTRRRAARAGPPDRGHSVPGGGLSRTDAGFSCRWPRCCCSSPSSLRPSRRRRMPGSPRPRSGTPSRPTLTLHTGRPASRATPTSAPPSGGCRCSSPPR